MYVVTSCIDQFFIYIMGEVYGSLAVRQRRGAWKGGTKTSDWQPGKARYCVHGRIKIVVDDRDIGGCLDLEGGCK